MQNDFRFTETTRHYFYYEPVDMRKGIHSLYQMIKTIISKQLSNPHKNLSNLDKKVKIASEISCNLMKILDLGNYEQKVDIQKTRFPSDIYYHREKGVYRTLKVNSFLAPSIKLSNLYKEHEKSGKLILDENSALVPPTGEMSNFSEDAEMIEKLYSLLKRNLK